MTLYIRRTIDGRTLVMRPACPQPISPPFATGLETGYQIVSERTQGGWSIHRVDPTFAGQRPDGYLSQGDALRALYEHLGGDAN